MAIPNNQCPHRNVSLETSNNIRGLLLLVPTNGSVQTQNTNNDTKIDPVFQTTRKKDGQFHDYGGVRNKVPT